MPEGRGDVPGGRGPWRASGPDRGHDADQDRAFWPRCPGLASQVRDRAAAAATLSPVKRRILALPRSRRSVRTTAAVAAVPAVVALTSACQVFSPVQTNVPYAPADGVPATVGLLQVSNLLLVSNGTGEAAVSGALYNSGNEPAVVQLAAQQQGGTPGPAAQVEVGPGQQLILSDKGVRLTGVTAKPGTMVPMTVQSSVGGATVVNVPVLPPERYYATLLPGGATPAEATLPSAPPSPTS